MRWGIYARADHPPGYGYSPHPGETGGRAHGYVLLAVDCGAESAPLQIRSVPVGNLAYTDPAMPWRDHVSHWHDTWYGGDFDLVLLTDSPPTISSHAGHTGHWRSIGDNRAVLLVSLDKLRASGAKT